MNHVVAAFVSCGRTLAVEARLRRGLDELEAFLVIRVPFEPQRVELAVDGSVLLSSAVETERSPAMAFNGSRNLSF